MDNIYLSFAPNLWHFAILFVVLAVIFSMFKDERKRAYDADFERPSMLSRFNKGFVVDGVQRLTRQDSYRNLLVSGGVGSFKTSAIILPSLKVADDCLLIVNDISGELLEGSFSDLKAKGYEIKLVKLRSPKISSGYDPLHRCSTKGQINKAAQTIVQSTLQKGSADPFWNQLAATLIGLLISYLKKHEPQYANLRNVYRMLKLMHAEPRAIDRRFALSTEELYVSYKSFIGYGDKIVSGVVASATAALQIMEDDDVARVTSVDTLGDFKQLRQRKVAVFIQNSVTDLQYLQFITDLFYTQFTESLLDTMPSNTDKDVWLVLDEFASSMQLPQAGSLFSTLRKTQTGIIAVCQDSRSQLKLRYGEAANTIISNCYSKIYLAGGLDLETAQYLEKRAGKFEYEDEKGIRRVRELVTADEVLRIPPKTGIIDMGSHGLVKVKLTPFFERFNFKRPEQVPIIFKSEVPTEVSLLPVNAEAK